MEEGKGLQMANWPNSPYLYCNVLHNSSRNGDGEDLHFFFMNSCFSANFHSVPDCLNPWHPHLVPLHITCSPASACLSAGGSRLVIIFPQGYPLAVDRFLWQMQGARSWQRALCWEHRWLRSHAHICQQDKEPELMAQVSPVSCLVLRGTLLSPALQFV